MIKNCVAAIGDFDGVHLGHQEILRQLSQWAESLSARAVVISFDINTKGQKLITEQPIKAQYLSAFGGATLETLEFERWKDVSADEFAERYLKDTLGAVGIIAGPDLHFGKDRAGNEFTLIGKGIAVRRIENVTMEDLRISSTAIRCYIQEGNLTAAEQRMGHPFALEGEVCHGKGLARAFGLPTANLAISERQLLPPLGVYAAWAEVEGQRYPAVANLGVRPTVEKNGALNLEAHLLGAAPELYGKKMRVELKSYLRCEKKFETQEELFLQIQKDGEESKARLEMLK